jgi:anti-sigma B factor antagonist
MSPLAHVTDEQLGAVCVASVAGEIDASNVRELRVRLSDALGNHGVALVIDLGSTSYLDSAAINVLFALGRELEQRRQQLHLVVPEGAPIARMLAITGLDHAVATHATRDAALAAIGR